MLEVMVALALTVIATASMYLAYVSVTSENEVQEQIMELQQNLRVGMQKITREIRMAGYDPTNSGVPDIGTANPSDIQFTADLNGDGDVTDPGEDIIYSLTDFDGDGDVDDLTRNDVIGTGPDPIILNCDWLNFVYLDAAGNVTATLADIRTIQLAVVARTSDEDFSYTDTGPYPNLSATGNYTPPANDNFHRRLYNAEIRCRNLGL